MALHAMMRAAGAVLVTTLVLSACVSTAPKSVFEDGGYYTMTSGPVGDIQGISKGEFQYF